MHITTPVGHLPWDTLYRYYNVWYNILFYFILCTIIHYIMRSRRSLIHLPRYLYGKNIIHNNEPNNIWRQYYVLYRWRSSVVYWYLLRLCRVTVHDDGQKRWDRKRVCHRGDRETRRDCNVYRDAGSNRLTATTTSDKLLWSCARVPSPIGYTYRRRRRVKNK